MTGINEMIREAKSDLDREFNLIELFRKNATVIGDPKILDGISTLMLDTMRHFTQISKLISEIQSQIASDMFSMTDIVKDVEQPLDKPALVEFLADVLKEEKAMQLMYGRLLKVAKDETQKELILKMKSDEIRHEKMVLELLDYLSEEK